jgi:ribokinase
MRVAVVGHVEWVEFARVARVPLPGEIVQAREWWSEAAGGGGVASVQLRRLAGACTLFTAFGRDDPARQRRGFTFVDEGGERTITIIGEKHVPEGSDPLPWTELEAADAVYFVSGDADAARAARRARVLVATARVLPTLAEAGVELDALVRSGRDPSERYAQGDLAPVPRLVVTTEGAGGGSWTSSEGPSGGWAPAPLPGELVDSYGAGDSFAAGLTVALGRGAGVDAALEFAARCASEALTRPGAHGLYAGADSSRLMM